MLLVIVLIAPLLLKQLLTAAGSGPWVTTLALLCVGLWAALHANLSRLSGRCGRAATTALCSGAV